MDVFGKIVENLGFPISLVIIYLWIDLQRQKRFQQIFDDLIQRLKTEIDELKEDYQELREKLERYLIKDNSEIKSALERNQQLLQETTSTLDNAIEVIKLNTQAYDNFRVANEKFITYLTEHLKLFQQWKNKS